MIKSWAPARCGMHFFVPGNCLELLPRIVLKPYQLSNKEGRQRAFHARQLQQTSANRGCCHARSPSHILLIVCSSQYAGTIETAYHTDNFNLYRFILLQLGHGVACVAACTRMAAGWIRPQLLTPADCRLFCANKYIVVLSLSVIVATGDRIDVLNLLHKARVPCCYMPGAVACH
jgi:hypothetical protein